MVICGFSFVEVLFEVTCEVRYRLLLPGSTWNFQLWYRDPMAGGAGYKLSDVVAVEFRD